MKFKLAKATLVLSLETDMTYEEILAKLHPDGIISGTFQILAPDGSVHSLNLEEIDELEFEKDDKEATE